MEERAQSVVTALLPRVQSNLTIRNLQGSGPASGSDAMPAMHLGDGDGGGDAGEEASPGAAQEGKSEEAQGGQGSPEKQGGAKRAAVMNLANMVGMGGAVGGLMANVTASVKSFIPSSSHTYATRVTRAVCENKQGGGSSRYYHLQTNRISTGNT